MKGKRMQTYRTAVFTLHRPTRHVCAVLDNAFMAYTRAYTTALHAFRALTPEEALELATWGMDSTGRPQRSSKKLESRLFTSPPPSVTAALQPLQHNLREGVREQVGRTFFSWAQLITKTRAGAVTATDKKAHVHPRSSIARTSSGDVTRPSRARPGDGERLRHAALHEIVSLADDEHAERALRDRLQRTADPSVVGLVFVRIAANRTCGLFYNATTRRFYARLFVVPWRSKHARRITAAGQYQDVRTGEVYLRTEDAAPWQGMRSFGASRASILVPLEMGRWHEAPQRFSGIPLLSRPPLTPSSDADASVAVPIEAALVKRGPGQYDLHVVFRLPLPPRRSVTTLLGIDRGIGALAAGAVVSLDTRQVIAELRYDGREMAERLRTAEQAVATGQQRGRRMRAPRRRTRIGDQYVAQCANAIVALADAHTAQVVMEDLSTFSTPHRPPRPAGRTAMPQSNYRRMLTRRQYQKLLLAVNARLPLVGLPPVRLVSPSYTSITCSRCGLVDRHNRDPKARERFHCVGCGFVGDADVQAGINIARKAHWLDRRIAEAHADVPTVQRTPWATFVAELLVDAAQTEAEEGL